MSSLSFLYVVCSEELLLRHAFNNFWIDYRNFIGIFKSPRVQSPFPIPFKQLQHKMPAATTPNAQSISSAKSVGVLTSENERTARRRRKREFNVVSTPDYATTAATDSAASISPHEAAVSSLELLSSNKISSSLTRFSLFNILSCKSNYSNDKRVLCKQWTVLYYKWSIVHCSVRAAVNAGQVL